MNLDVEGFGGFALENNDWENEKCIPDVILAESNEWNTVSKSGNVRSLL